MTTLFIVIGCIAGFNAIYLFFYIMDDIVSQIRKISKPKKQTADFTFWMIWTNWRMSRKSLRNRKRLKSMIFPR